MSRLSWLQIESIPSIQLSFGLVVLIVKSNSHYRTWRQSVTYSGTRHIHSFLIFSWRYGIFRLHTSRMSLSDDVDLEEFIMTKDDLSGADIKAVCTEAGLLALRERRMRVTKADFTTAREKVWGSGYPDIVLFAKCLYVFTGSVPKKRGNAGGSVLVVSVVCNFRFFVFFYLFLSLIRFHIVFDANYYDNNRINQKCSRREWRRIGMAVDCMRMKSTKINCIYH